ncbi:MAG: pyridoxamine 5'-phosphate oxidase family protein [Pseudomonadota bacterium]
MRRRMMVNLNDYFDNAQGTGVLATADSSGKVNAAVYARPHFFDETTVAFIMRERLTHENLKTNPHATYLFIESKPGYSGKRLYLTKLREETDDELTATICRRCDYTMFTDKLTRHVVFFTIDKVLPLIGSGRLEPQPNGD